MTHTVISVITMVITDIIIVLFTSCCHSGLRPPWVKDMSLRIYLKFPNDRWVLHLLLSLAPVELEGVTKVRQALKGLHVLQLCVIHLPHVGRREEDKGKRGRRGTEKEEET